MPKVVSLTGGSETELKPRARPVKVGYVARDVARADNLTAIAEALSSLQPSLRRFAEKRAEEQKDADLAQGQLVYEMESNRQSWSDFVKANPQHAKANPWIREGYLRARMANEGENYRSWIQAQASGPNASVDIGGTKVPLSEATPEQSALWFQQQKQRYVQEVMGGETDPVLFSEIFIPMAEAAERELNSRIISYQQDVMWNKAIGEHTKLITNTIRGAVEAGAFDGPDAEQNMASLGARFSDVARQLIRDGVPPKQVNDAIVDSIVTFADANDIDDVTPILDIVKHIETSPGSYLGDIPEVAKMVEGAKDAIRTERYWDRKQKEELKRAEELEARRADEIAIVNQFITNPLRMPKSMQNAFAQKYGVDALTGLLNDLRSIHNYAKGDGDGSRGGKLTKADYDIMAAVNQGDPTVTPEKIINSNLTDSKKLEYLEKLSEKGNGLSKTQNKDIRETAVKLAFQAITYGKGNPDEASPEEQQLGYTMANDTLWEFNELLKASPEAKNNEILQMRLLAQAAATTQRIYGPYTKVIQNSLRANPEAKVQDIVSQNLNFSGLSPELRAKVEPLAQEHLTMVTSGAGPSAPFLQYIKELERATGHRNLNPDEIAKLLLRKGG
jgi:hypothetical protein